MNWEFIFWLFYFFVGLGSCLGFWLLDSTQKDKKHSSLDKFMGGIVAGVFWVVVLGMKIWIDDEE